MIMPILNYTTKIKPEKTISEIQQMLVRRGARKMVIDYNDSMKPVALSFMIMWKERATAFALPCNFEGVLRSMKHDKVTPSLLNDEHAINVGWRILKDVLAAQMAYVDSEMMTLAEVFLSGAITKNGKTLYEFIEQEKDVLLLENYT